MKSLPQFVLTVSLSQVLCISSPSFSSPESVASIPCPLTAISTQAQSLSKEQTYQNVPFNQGELASYRVYYMGIMVGYGHLQVMPPILYKKEWLWHFSAHASTGDWYRAIFAAKDQAVAYARPGSFAVRKFYLKQDEGKLFGKRLIQEKWLNFHENICTVEEIIRKDQENSPRKEQSELAHNATDVLSAVYRLRSVSYSDTSPRKFLVYSSRKNWWLEAAPMKHESITVPAGTFSAVRLRLQTFLGQDLQQKGDVHIWIADQHPSHPLLKVEGEIKIGSVVMELNEFVPGGSNSETGIKGPTPQETLPTTPVPR